MDPKRLTAGRIVTINYVFPETDWSILAMRFGRPSTTFLQEVESTRRLMHMLSDYPIFTSIPASDLDRAVAWYKDKLGFEPAEDPPLPNGDEGIFFNAGEGTRFYVYPTRESPGAGHTIAEFAVGDDFDKVIDELRAAGVVFEEYDFPGFKTVNGIAELTGPQGHRVAWFKDSEQNILAIGSYG